MMEQVDEQEMAEERPAISDREMLSIVRNEVDNALGWTGTRLTQARQRNLEAWFGNKRGDEVEGRSQATSRVTFEQVEQILPGLLEPFVSVEEVCEFIPQGPEDEESAKAATQGCNHVFRTNGGLEILMTMFRDALIQRNGIVKVYWDESQEGYFETYEGKTIEEIALLNQDRRFEFKEATPVLVDERGEVVEIEDGADLTGIDPRMLRYTVKGVRRPDDGRVRIENVPPEEFLINRDARGIDHPTARFLAQRIRTTVSDLIASGVDPEVAKQLPSSQPSSTTETAARMRSSQQDGNDFGFTDRTDSQRQVLVTEAYVLLDSDGDGISEWWRVLVGGEYAQSFISADPVDGHPFASVTPIPIPHRFYGLSLADVVSDINEIQTTLWRQYLDSLYLSTDPRTVVLSQGGPGDTAVPMVNLEQLVDATPGTYIEEYAPGALRPFEQKSNAADIIPALSMHKEMLQSRTGITPEGQGIDPNAINKTAYGVMVQQSASAQRSTLIARIFAETGVRKIFKLIYKELLQHGQAMQVYTGGTWVTMNPGDWATNLDAQIAVGLGHGTRMEKVANLQTVAQLQEKLLTGGFHNMVTPRNVYETVTALTEALGFKGSERFFTDPEENPMPPAEPDAAEKAIEAQQQIETMKLELDRQRIELDRFKAMGELKVKELAHEVDVAKVNLEGAKLSMDEPWSLEVEDEQDDLASLVSGIDEAISQIARESGVPIQ